MKIAGFNFTKINAEKLSGKRENLKINANIDVSEIKQLKADAFKSKDEFLGIKFGYTIDYSPDFAKIELLGDIIVTIESKKAKEILKQWKDKKIHEDIRIPLFNIILKKSSLKALELEEELSLPLHVSMPSLKKEDISQAKK